jgi:hypothetical protein
MNISGHYQKIGLPGAACFSFPTLTTAAREKDHTRASILYGVDGNQLSDCFADTLLRTTRKIDIKLFGMRRKSFPVVGPTEEF